MSKLSATQPSTHAHQFDDAAQQRDAATFGMWVFLATEVLFFGGMFLVTRPIGWPIQLPLPKRAVTRS